MDIHESTEQVQAQRSTSEKLLIAAGVGAGVLLLAVAGNEVKNHVVSEMQENMGDAIEHQIFDAPQSQATYDQMQLGSITL